MPSRPLISCVAALLVLLCAPGCSTLSHWQQQHRDASLRRREADEAADAHADPAAYQATKRRLAQHDARLRSLQAALAKRTDADSLAASAAFEWALVGYNRGTSLALAARAVAAAPARADLAFVQLQICESSPQCDAAPLEEHLRQMDPRNGVTWVYALLRADRAKDPAGRSAAFYGLSQSERIESYWNRIVAHLTAAATGTAGFEAGPALTQVLGIQTTFALALDPISKLCLVPQLQSQMLEPCRRVATAFRQGDTAVVEAYGSSLALNLWPKDSAEGQQIAAQRRLLRYRVALMNQNETRLNSAQATKALADLVGRYPTEQAAYRAFCLRLGLNPDPADNWRDPAPGR